MTLAVLLALVAAVLWVGFAARAALVVARILQVEEYDVVRTGTWGRRQPWLFHRSVLVATAVTAVAGIAGAALPPDARRALLCAGWAGGSAAGLALWRWLPPKKALVVTARMRRLMVAGVLDLALTGCAMAGAALLLPYGLGVIFVVFGVLCTTSMAVSCAAVAVRVLRPAEARINAGYVRTATARVRELSPEIVAIAGSYGKTSTKHILGALLTPSTPTLVTPKSFNTLMGVTRTVNEQLSATQRTFVVEMDAYDVGEIASICRVAPPGLAVVTSVGPQHLERFGTVQRIADALYEVVAALPPGGTAVIYAGERESRRLADRAARAGVRVVRYGMEGDGELEVTASQLRVDPAGSHFRVRWAAEAVDVSVNLPLLGSHQVLNTAAALAVVRLLGHDLEAAVGATATLEPVPHRLQPVPTANGITVIDDSYNANPVGVHNGLDVLAAMPPGQRILVTPGLVELGPLEEAENRRYGAHAARVCDQVIVVSSRPGVAVLAGLREGGLDAARVHEVASLAGATEAIGRLARPGDCVLFANDLPDTYL
ncbi:MAG: Mur ligase family protein [Candidatus Dormibacteria bacterium]